jgi:hypothetical protein
VHIEEFAEKKENKKWVRSVHVELRFGTQAALALKQRLEQDPQHWWARMEPQFEEDSSRSSIANDPQGSHEAAFGSVLLKTETAFHVINQQEGGKLQNEGGLGCSRNINTPLDPDFRQRMSRFKAMVSMAYVFQGVPWHELPKALRRMMQDLPAPVEPAGPVKGVVGAKRGFTMVHFLP